MNKDELSNVEIALFALHETGGATKRIHTEHIAWESYKLAPEKFSWRLPEYREKGFPDKTPVRFALEQAKKKEHGKLVRGRAGGDVGGKVSEGWIFTDNGIEWIKKNKSRIEKLLNVESKPEIHPRDVKRFLNKIKKEPAYQTFQEEGNLENVSIYMFTDMLGCTPDAPKETIKEEFDRFFNTAKLCDNRDPINFLNKCAKHFPILKG